MMARADRFPATRVGVVGAGAISHAHVSALLELGVPVTAFSRHGAAELVARYGIPECSTFEELLMTCEVIDVCTPTPTHLGYIEAALGAGRHVICEKPVVRHSAQGSRVRQLADAAGRLVLPAHVVRYFPQYIDAHKAAHAGELGAVREAWFSRGAAFPSSRWFADSEQSGGVVLDLMIHDLDAARWIVGEVARVQASVRSVPGRARAEAVLTHVNGAVSHVTAFWDEPDTSFRTSIRLDGSTGRFEHDSAGDPATAPTPRTPAATAESPADAATAETLTAAATTESPYLTQLREFLIAITGGPVPRVALADGIRAVELAEAVLDSAASGRAVAV